MARVTIKKVPKGYQVSLFRKKLGSKEVAKDNLGIFKTKTQAKKEASLARRLAN